MNRPHREGRRGCPDGGGTKKGIDWETVKARPAETESESESESDAEVEVEVQTEPEVKEEESRVSGSRGEEWSGASVDPRE